MSPKLTAIWNPGLDPSLDDASSAVWDDGSIASPEDVRFHALDTHSFKRNQEGETECHMFPDIIADVTFNALIQDWMTSGKDVVAMALDLKDPNATNEQITAELHTFPIVYRARIIRS